MPTRLIWPFGAEADLFKEAVGRIMKFIKIQTKGSATKPLSETEKSLLKTRNKGINDMANKKP